MSADRKFIGFQNPARTHRQLIEGRRRIAALEQQLAAARNYEQSLLLRLQGAEAALKRENAARDSRLDSSTIEITMRTISNGQLYVVQHLADRLPNGSEASMMGSICAKLYIALKREL